MIIQFFPRIHRVRGLAYNANPIGALEIIPKPSGIGIFNRPSILSTHAVRDEFLSHEEYDTNGLRRMKNDQGFECLMIEHSLHGRYLQIGRQDRDAYTRYLANYQNPTEWNPPKPWSCRIKKRLLLPLELCVPTPTEKHMCFQGRYRASPTGEKLISDVDFSSRIHFASVQVSDLVPTSAKKSLRTPGTVDISTDDKTKWGLTFSQNINIALENSEYTHLHTWKNLADELIDAKNSDSKTLIPDPNTMTNKFLGMVSCLLFPEGKEKYIPPKREWKPYDITPFLKYEGDSRLNAKTKTSTFPIFTNDITKNAGVEWKCDSWIAGIENYAMCRTECFFEWPVVTYTPLTGAPLQNARTGLDTQEKYTKCRPLCFVPLMAAFVPSAAYKGPIDHRTGRRICVGSAIFAFLTTGLNPKTFYPNDALLSLSMTQIRWPVTRTPIFDEAFDMAWSTGYRTGVPEQEVAEDAMTGPAWENAFQNSYTDAKNLVNFQDVMTTMDKLMTYNREAIAAEAAEAAAQAYYEDHTRRLFQKVLESYRDDYLYAQTMDQAAEYLAEFLAPDEEEITTDQEDWDANSMDARLGDGGPTLRVEPDAKSVAAVLRKTVVNPKIRVIREYYTRYLVEVKDYSVGSFVKDIVSFRGVYCVGERIEISGLEYDPRRHRVIRRLKDDFFQL